LSQSNHFLQNDYKYTPDYTAENRKGHKQCKKNDYNMNVKAFIQFTFRNLLYLLLFLAKLNISFFCIDINQAIIIPVFLAIHYK